MLHAILLPVKLLIWGDEISVGKILTSEVYLNTSEVNLNTFGSVVLSSTPQNKLFARTESLKLLLQFEP